MTPAHAQGAQGNIRLGDLVLSLKGSFEVELNDNINYSNSNKQGDIILRPGLTVSTFYQLSEINSLSLDVGLSYDQYIFHNNLSSYSNFASVTPDSQLAYTILINNQFTIKLYDSFSYSVQPSDAFAFDPKTGKLITNVRAYARFMNQIGFNIDWDLKRIVLYAGAYRYDVFPQQQEFSFLRRWQYTFTVGARWLASPNLTISLGVNYTMNYYQEQIENNSDSWFFGPTVIWQPAQNWSISFNGGYVLYGFQQNGTNGDASQPSTYTGELSITNKLSKTINHTLTLSRTSSFGYVSNAITIDRIAYQIAWQFRPKWTAKFWAYYEDGKDSGGASPEHYEKYALSPELDYDMSKKTSFYIIYTYTQKDSNFTSRVYTQNKLILGVRYEF